jgi:hypothetical protein
MATSIKSTALDFTNIKQNLKDYLKAQTEFKDYNFEASGLSNILDVLAYNTHINGLTSNFAINESFLGTAQLRSSVVSLATGIGYVPDSKTSAQGTINISVDLSAVSGRPSTIALPAYTKFTATIDDVAYTFQTKEVYSATDTGSGVYTFKTSPGSSAIPIFEGTLKEKTFLVGASEDRFADAYIVPDLNIDTDTAIVRVYDSYASSSSAVYINITKANVLNSNSTIYILKEAPNGFYQLSFGGGGALGKSPVAGNAITLQYISTGGKTGNLATSYTAQDTISVGGISYNLTVSSPTISSGGDDRETIESIRKNAPFQYATQNRMVTPEDYTAIILRNYSSLINDIVSWGGEDDASPKFGTVFTSIDFEADVTADKQVETKAAITELVKQLAVVSFDIEYTDPVSTFVESDIFYQINPQLTSLSNNAITTSINTVVSNYFAKTLGKFTKSFRRSNLLTLVDDVSRAVLSSRAVIRMQQRITPTLNTSNTFTLTFPNQIAQPIYSTNVTQSDYVVRSSNFEVDGVTCRIINETHVTAGVAKSSRKLQVVNAASGLVIVDNIGEYNSTTRQVSIVSFKPSSIIGGNDFIKISVLPANQSAISPLRNDILIYDGDESTIFPVTVTSDN